MNVPRENGTLLKACQFWCGENGTMLKAITFDLWGTLIDARHNLIPQRLEYLVQILPGRSLEQAREAYHKADEQFSAMTNLGFPYSTATMLSLTLDAMDASLPPLRFVEALQQWKEVLLGNPPPLLDGVPEVLSALHQDGLHLAVISDTGLTPGRDAPGADRLWFDRLLGAPHLLRCGGCDQTPGTDISHDTAGAWCASR
jgi:hypothetical protein